MDVLNAEGALRLVHVRAQAMAEACKSVDGSMAAVIGLDEPALRAAQPSRLGSVESLTSGAEQSN